MQTYRPLELLFTIAAVSTLAENFLPQLIALPKVCKALSSHTGSMDMSQPMSLLQICGT